MKSNEALQQIRDTEDKYGFTLDQEQLQQAIQHINSGRKLVSEVIQAPNGAMCVQNAIKKVEAELGIELTREQWAQANQHIFDKLKEGSTPLKDILPELSAAPQ